MMYRFPSVKIIVSLVLLTPILRLPTLANDPAFWQALMHARKANQPLTMAFPGDQDRAIQFQDRFVQFLQTDFGGSIGYKAALTSPPAQKRFGVNRPLLGVLLEGMILPSGSRVPKNFAAVPIVEADLVVRVADASINDASTEAEALLALDAVFPFLELADLVFAPNAKITGPGIVAINTGARAGILGQAIQLSGEDWPDRLATFTTEVYGPDKNRWSQGKGSNLLGHPLKAVLWIRDEVQARGGRLKQGDLLSLGSLTPPRPLGDATSVEAIYHGLTHEPIRISVLFEDREP